MNFSPPPDPHVWVTILAGGSGTRFWPVSTPKRPKQVLPLAGSDPLIVQTLRRARLLAPDERIRILASAPLTRIFRPLLPDLGPQAYLEEPEPRGTAPVLVWAAWTLLRDDPRAVLVSLHADHAVAPEEAFRDLLLEGVRLASSEDLLFTVAVPPTRPETGYGYLEPGSPLPGRGPWRAFRVRAFVEKPDRTAAQRYLDQGYLWNTGIFLWRAEVFLEEVRRCTPELADLIPLLEKGQAEEFFRRAPNLSVDEGVLERSPRVACLEATFRWDDVGGWEALARTRPADAQGNVAVSPLYGLEAEGNIVWADEGAVVLFGVRDLVVVRSGEVVFVAPRARTAELKVLLRGLPPELRDPD